MIGGIHQATGHGIRRICATLRVPGAATITPPHPLPCRLPTRGSALEIEVIFKRHRRRYGYRESGTSLPTKASPEPPPESAESCLNAASRPSSPRPTCREPAMAGPTSHPQSSAGPAPSGETQPGVGRRHHLHSDRRRLRHHLAIAVGHGNYGPERIACLIRIRIEVVVACDSHVVSRIEAYE